MRTELEHAGPGPAIAFGNLVVIIAIRNIHAQKPHIVGNTLSPVMQELGNQMRIQMVNNRESQ